jgi:hypothetical protein
MGRAIDGPSENWECCKQMPNYPSNLGKDLSLDDNCRLGCLPNDDKKGQKAKICLNLLAEVLQSEFA